LILIVGIFTACEKVNDKPGIEGDLYNSRLKAVEMPVCGSEFIVDLIAAQHTIVGNVTVSQDGNNLIVEYNINEDGYLISETHLSVKQNLKDIPQTKDGSPKIGLFEYSNYHDPGVESFTYTINVAGSGPVYIAAHAVVQYCYDIEYMENIGEYIQGLIPTAMVPVSYIYPGGATYLQTTLSGINGWLDGTHPGYCARPNLYGFPTSGYIVSSLTNNDILACLVDKPENLNVINWMINQAFISLYTAGEIQWVIWQLLDNNPPLIDESSNGGPNGSHGGSTWNQVKAQELLDLVNTNWTEAVAFIPGCGQYVILIVDPGSCTDSLILPGKQVTLFYIPIDCGQECDSETAWGYGNPFNKSWAMWFQYCFVW
jgi:hypothetical protein